MHKNKFSELREKAEKILKECRLKKEAPDQDMTTLVNELSLYQIELEIQNEDLIKTQVELEASRDKYIKLYDLAPVGYFAITKEGLIKEVNVAGANLLDLPKSSLINRCFSRYISPEYQTIFSQYRLQAFKERTFQSFDVRLIRWSQPSFYASLECSVINGERANQPLLLMFVTDITVRKQSEDSLHKQRIKMASIDRLRSLNELVIAMAQDQNNYLTMIDNYVHGCINRLESGKFKIEDLVSSLKKVSDQSRSLVEILSTRRNITAKTIFRYEYADINTIINQTISLLNHEMLEFPVSIQYEASSDFSQIKLDRFHIQHAILNLARNAMEAMRDSKIQEPKLLIETAKTTANMLEISFFDNGPGLAQESIARLFEPHFTTKSYSIGLGLTVSRAIIEKHGGHLYAQSNPSGGACFGFTLPYS